MSRVLELLVGRLAPIVAESRDAADTAAAVHARAVELHQLSTALLQQARIEQARDAMRKASERATESRPRPVDLAAVARERDAEAAIEALRAAGLRTVILELDEEGGARVIQLPQGISAEAIRALGAKEVA